MKFTKNGHKILIVSGLVGLAVITGYFFLDYFLFASPRTCGGSREREGRHLVGTINRAQQAYHFERQTFASNWEHLGISLPSNYYDYSIEVINNVAYSFAIPKNPEQDSNLPSYSGLIFFNEETNKYSQVVCKTNESGEKGGKPAKPILQNGDNSCGENMTSLL